jgi:hypothetical protein
MVISVNERSAKKPAKQGIAEDTRNSIQINGSTKFDFEAKNLTAYGGLLPVATMLEKLKTCARSYPCRRSPTSTTKAKRRVATQF